jgi:hypothetical protein
MAIQPDGSFKLEIRRLNNKNNFTHTTTIIELK